MESLLNTILSNYMNDLEGTQAVAICDRDGLIIASQGKGTAEETSEGVIGVISAVLDSYIDRIKKEFGSSETFFNVTTTGERKFAYCSQGPKAILTTIASPGTSDNKLRVYSEHVANKIEMLLDGNDNVSLEISHLIKAISELRGGKLPTGDYTMKLIMTGDYAVGKTSLIKRFVENTFNESYMSTLGVEFSKKVEQLGESTKVSFIIWDIAGQSMMMAPYRAKFYNGANAAFIVVDRTREGNQESVKKWYEDIKKSVQGKIPIIVVGNKSDLQEELVISEEQLKEAAQELGFTSIFTSAKTGENVNDAFQYIAYKVLSTY